MTKSYSLMRIDANHYEVLHSGSVAFSGPRKECEEFINHWKDFDMDIKSTLSERGNRYGSFTGHAAIAQKLKEVVDEYADGEQLDYFHLEALHMILHKIARIVNGDPNYTDSWHDIAGYATLVEKIIKGENP